METKEIQETKKTLTDLIQQVSNFKEEQINIIPFEGSWSAGQLTQHMILANSGFVEILNGPVKETQRKPDEMVSKIKADFLNFDIKMTSPAIIVPKSINYDKDELLTALKNMRETAIKAISTLDLTKTCMAFELPIYGYLTRLEAVYFIIYHTQRHIHQLKNIYRKVKDYRPVKR